HYSDGKNQIAKTVSVDLNDVEQFKRLKELGVTCYVQGVPTESATDLFTLL
ncbi:PTS sugar transporter subunit IIB, partial [Photobacterium damselae]